MIGMHPTKTRCIRLRASILIGVAACIVFLCGDVRADDITTAPRSTETSGVMETWPFSALLTVRDHSEDSDYEFREREIEPAAPYQASLWSVRDLFGHRETPVVTSLLGHGNASVRPVRTLRIPTPLAYLGNPAAWSTRFRAAYGSNFDGRSMIYGNAIINTRGALGIDTEFSRRDDGNRRILPSPQFWVGDANFVYRVSQIRNVILRVGGGVNWMDGVGSTEIGFNTTYGIDVYLAKPWLISTTLDWGSLGSDSLWHWQITGGLDFGWLELFVGYDFHQIGGRERKNVLAGVGIWF